LDDCENIKSNILIFAIVTFALLCSFLAYFGIWTSLKRAGLDTSRRTTIIAKRLVMVYSLAIIASWIPWWIRWVFVNFIDQEGNQNDLDYLSTFSIGTFIVLFRSLWTPMRGYIHAVAVFWVFRVVAVTDKITFKNSWRYFFLMKKLDNGESTKTSNEQQSLEQSIEAPDWTIDSKDAGFSTTFPNSILSYSGRYNSRISAVDFPSQPFRGPDPDPRIGRFAPRTTSRPKLNYF
jgi:ABC-type multidrug transport system fused ATPase/permease subunit